MRHTRKLTGLSGIALAGLLAIAAGPATGADAKAGKAKAGVCAGCHGVNGQSAQPIWPNIAGQGAVYAERQLQAFKSGVRNNAQMAPIVAMLSPEDMANLAAYFATLEPAQGKADAAQAPAGEALYRGGDAARGIPACMSCHGPGGRGMASAGFPAVAGQHAQYAVTQLQAFASGARAADPQNMMGTIASRMDEASMRAVSEYMAGLR